jgi:hypothetical protein
MAHPPSDDEGFVSRWSQLKQRAREEDSSRVVEPEPQPALPVPAEPSAETAKAPDEDQGKKPFDLAELPSIESLTKDSDYAPFMRAEVPEDLRQKALRKLWASDPVLSAPEVLDMHNLDYNNVPTFPEGIKTLYRVGQGMLDSLEAEEAEKKAAAAKSRPEAQIAAEASPESEPEDAAPQRDDGVPSSETPENSSNS